MGASRLVWNPHVDRSAVPSGGTPSPSFHASLPDFAVTPVRAAPTVAARLGVGAVLVKDEGRRAGMPSFKILGASWATYRAVSAKLGRVPSPNPSLDELREVLRQEGRPVSRRSCGVRCDDLQCRPLILLELSFLRFLLCFL